MASLSTETTAPLSWSRRMMIALGAAKGLAFLHNAERPVIYRDFKTSNILLDSVTSSYFSFVAAKCNNLSTSKCMYACAAEPAGLHSQAFRFWLG